MDRLFAPTKMPISREGAHAFYVSIFGDVETFEISEPRSKEEARTDRVVGAFLTLLRLKAWTMTTSELHAEVRGEVIVVTEPETGFYALYTKPSDEPQLKAQYMPLGTRQFKAPAWQAANDKARELGWIVSDAADD
jgi:hypothetical protein